MRKDSGPRKTESEPQPDVGAQLGIGGEDAVRSRINTRRRTVLLISRAFYPANLAPSHRIAKFARYLPKRGWEAVILCADWTPQGSFGFYDPGLSREETCETFRVPYAIHPKTSIKGILDRLTDRLLPVVYSWDLRRLMLARAEELVKRRKFDAILATSPPLMTLAIAHRVAQKYAIPWVADLRDLPDEWAERPSLLSRWQVRQELAVCKSATALVTVSPPLAAKLTTRYRAPVYVVYNGFDPGDFPTVEGTDSECFTIVYCGQIYGGRDPAPLFDALDSVLREGRSDLARLRLRFYGKDRSRLLPQIRGRPCAKLVEFMGQVPFSEAIRAEQQASVLLLLSHPGTRGIATSKIFEYLGAGRPILSVPGDQGVTDALIKQTNAGIVAGTPDEIANCLLDWYTEYQQTGTVRYRGSPETFAQYTRAVQAARMTQVLDEVCR